MAFSDLEIRNAWEDSLAAGFTPEQIYQGAAANFGLSKEQVDKALKATSTIPNSIVQSLFQTGTVSTASPVVASAADVRAQLNELRSQIGSEGYDILEEALQGYEPPAPIKNTFTTASGQTYNYNDVVNLINARYAEGKTPALAVKSALQLGFPEDVIRTLPGVDAKAFEEGKRLIQSGAFTEQATGTMADIQQAAPVGSAQYNARIAAGLDAFGFPPEEVAKLTAQGLYGPGKKYDPGTSSSNNIASVIQELNAEISAENPTVSRVLEDGSRVVSYGDGLYAYSKPGEDRYALYDTAGNLQGFESQRNVRGGVEYTTFNPEGKQIDQRVASTTPGLAGILAPIALTAMGGYALGPAASGLLSTPAAAATSAGGMTLFQGGSAEDALKAAALAGALGYGIENLFPSDALKAGKTAVDLAGSGGTVDSITQTLVNQGVPSSTARTIAAEALAGSSASQIASDFAGLTLGGAGSTSLASTAATNPNLVNVLGSTAPTAGSGLLSSIVSAAPAIIPSLATMAGTAPSESVTVQGQNLPKTQVTTQDLLAALTPAITGTLPSVAGGTQSVDVSGTRVGTTNENLINSLIPALTTAAIPAAAGAATQPSGTQQVEVSAKKDQSLLPFITSPVIAAIPALPAGIKAELPKPAQPPAEKSVFNPSDILKLIGLLGGAGAGAALSQAGTGTISTPPSDTMLGTTTPQFGPDYYAAVQRYYNAYMPETPRNVATPLQQWYENKFGA